MKRILLVFHSIPLRNANVSYFDQFFDAKDGKLDMSQWLSGQTGFLPIHLVIPDQAVGYGSGLAVAFCMMPKKNR